MSSIGSKSRPTRATNSWRQQAGAWALALCSLSVAGAASANPACQWYVTQSAKQQQENQRREIGGVGDEVALALEETPELRLQVCVQLGLGNGF